MGKATGGSLRERGAAHPKEEEIALLETTDELHKAEIQERVIMSLLDIESNS